MQTAPIPNNEEQRLEAVHKLAILDTGPEERFDKLTREAVEKLQVPMSMVSILDSNREWFKSCVGFKSLTNLHKEETEGDRSVSFCGHALLAKEIFIIEDTLQDERFKDNPLVIGYPFIRFYAGIALHEYGTNHAIGVFCIKDTKPRVLSLVEMDIILDLAKRAEKELNSTQKS
jgi:GAF domain-containing protein